MMLYELNYIRILFSSMISSVILFSTLMNGFEKFLPTFVKQSFRYGKFSYTGKVSDLVVEVPKRWFRHFYIYSSVLTCCTLGLVINVYVFESQPPYWLKVLLDELAGFLRKSTVSHVHVLLAMALLTLQCVRRLYDTHFVSVFSQTSKINLFHYVIGFTHYTGSVLAILVEAPIFSPSDPEKKLNVWDLKLIDLLAVGLFLCSWWHQYKATVILGNLRKDSKGAVVSQKYRLPEGDWFKYISSPHSTTEILMYFSLTIILWGNITWLFIAVWVLTNQVESILLSHWWYQENFKDFPEERKALIPFVY